jgi:hypothetical protein
MLEIIEIFLTLTNYTFSAYFSACWNCYAQSTKPKVPLGVVQLDFNMPNGLLANQLFVEDLLDHFPQSATVVVASSGQS